MSPGGAVVRAVGSVCSMGCLVWGCSWGSAVCDRGSLLQCSGEQEDGQRRLLRLGRWTDHWGWAALAVCRSWGCWGCSELGSGHWGCSMEGRRGCSREQACALADCSYLVDPASSTRLFQRLSHACLSISTCTVKLRMAHYISYNLFDSLFTTWITVVILELIHAKSPTLWKGCIY